MKIQDLVIIIVFFFFIVSGGSKPNVIPSFERNVSAYEGEIAYKVLDTNFVGEEIKPPDIITPDVKNCPCKGTKLVRSPDGIATIACPCGDSCPCKKPQGKLIDTTKVTSFTYMFTTDWCGYCVKFKNNEVPHLKKVGWKVGYDKYSEGDNLVIIDADKNKELYNRYKKNDSLPLFVVVRNDKELGQTTGYLNSSPFSTWSNNLVNPNKSVGQPTKQVIKQPAKQVTNCPLCPTKTKTVYKRQILFGEPWVENGRNTTVQHLINVHGYTREQLAPYANNPNALNRIHGYAHTHKVR